MQFCNICATRTEHKKFKTFEYYWCPKCKDEVKLPEPEKNQVNKNDDSGCLTLSKTGISEIESLVWEPAWFIDLPGSDE